MQAILLLQKDVAVAVPTCLAFGCAALMAALSSGKSRAAAGIFANYLKVSRSGERVTRAQDLSGAVAAVEAVGPLALCALAQCCKMALLCVTWDCPVCRGRGSAEAGPAPAIRSIVSGARCGSGGGQQRRLMRVLAATATAFQRGILLVKSPHSPQPSAQSVDTPNANKRCDAPKRSSCSVQRAASCLSFPEQNT
ncbi:hypothetical protein GQ54DRAFT_94336 [Martensiomyces pterosporus]|nr:hypothetical protein GQ54DRAFT_94336 [Martensiomyces pterosporus]